CALTGIFVSRLTPIVGTLNSQIDSLRPQPHQLEWCNIFLSSALDQFDEDGCFHGTAAANATMSSVADWLAVLVSKNTAPVDELRLVKRNNECNQHQPQEES